MEHHISDVLALFLLLGVTIIQRNLDTQNDKSPE